MSKSPEQGHLLDNTDDVFQPSEVFGKNYQEINNPQKQQQQEQHVNAIDPSKIEFENFTLGNQPAYNTGVTSISSSNSGNQNGYVNNTNPPPPQYNGPNVPLMQDENMGFGPTNVTVNGVPFQQQPGSQKNPNAHFWNIDYYKFLFDVDAKQVGHRLFRAATPYPPNFFSIIETNPDIYGPFWIATTLVFMMAATGNVAAYFKAIKTPSVDQWNFDINKLSFAAAAIYGYLIVIPLILFGVFKYFKVPLRLMDIICIYGYSFFIYVPIAFLSVIPFSWLQWTLIGIACIISTSMLIGNFVVALKEHRAKSMVIILVQSLLHVGFALTCKLYFFK